MYHYTHQLKVSYRMAAPPTGASQLTKSRGHSLFDRQAQLHALDPNQPFQPTISDNNIPLPALKPTHPLSSVPVSISATVQPRRSPLASTESYTHSNDDNVQLLRVQPRPDATYIKEVLATPPPPPQSVSIKLLETDFPLYDTPIEVESDQESNENSVLDDFANTISVEKPVDHLTTYDDDDDVIHQDNSNEQEYHGDSYNDEDGDYSTNTNDLDATTSTYHHRNDSGIHTLSSTGNNDKQNDQEILSDQQQLPMACSSRSTTNEEYDSDFDDSSHEDDEQLIRKDSINKNEEEQQNQVILRQQQILWGIVQEWLRKEEFYGDQLRKMDEQLNQNASLTGLQTLIQQLIELHKKVYNEIEDLYDGDHQLATLTQQLTYAVEILMQTLPMYDEYIRMNLGPIRKSLDKRTNTSGLLSSEDILSIPPKQYLQILSQVQDLYQTAQSFESNESENTQKLYMHAQRCRLYGSRQVENINKVILKNEDVATMGARGSRDRCRLILYPDAIVCCSLKAKLLTSPKYMLLWYISILDLQWTIPQEPSDNHTDTGDELKTNLKSVYKELEKAPKTSTVLSSRLSKSIRKQESEFNLAQSKLQLILSSTSRSSTSSSVVLFSSAYQLQDWIELIDKTKQELIQRSSAVLNQAPEKPRLTDTLIQKRLDFIKPNAHEASSNDSPANTQTMPSTKTYSGTLCFTIHSVQGSALANPTRQYQTLPSMSSPQYQTPKNYQFYVAVEIDSYNTFYPNAQTSKHTMQKQDSVEFKKEVFHIELEYSLAFRLLIYRVDPASPGTNNSLQRPTCIGKFHRDIETALHDCRQSSSGTICIESQSGDLKTTVSLKYSKRDGTFKRVGSKRSQAVFGKSIDKLILSPFGLIDGIPRIIVKCIKIVEEDGLNEMGIYRVCCVASDLQKLRHEFDRDYHHGEEMLAQKNVHVAANLLKLFFRELPEPLFSSALYKQFLHAIQLTDIDNQRVTLLKTIESLPEDNRRILFYLLDHLIRISQYSRINMMHLDNLAVVFGPTLMRPSKLIATQYYSGSNQRLNVAPNSGQATPTDLDQMSSELQGSMYQCQVVLACLKLRQDEMLR